MRTLHRESAQRLPHRSWSHPVAAAPAADSAKLPRSSRHEDGNDLAGWRTYGFYVQRDLGLYCHDLEALVASGSLADVVWGNQDAIDHRLAALGETRPLTEWFAAERLSSDTRDCRD